MPLFKKLEHFEKTIHLVKENTIVYTVIDDDGFNKSNYNFLQTTSSKDESKMIKINCIKLTCLHYLRIRVTTQPQGYFTIYH